MGAAGGAVRRPCEVSVCIVSPAAPGEDSDTASKPSTPSLLPRWHSSQSSLAGISYPVPPASSWPSVTSVASETPSGVQAYVVRSQGCAACFQSSRVSRRVPGDASAGGRRNSLNIFVPTGNVHSSMSVVSIFWPPGR